MDKNEDRKGRFAKNLSINTLNFIVNILSGILVIPILVNQIGVEALGLVQIAVGLSLYMNLITTSLNQGNNRALLIALNSGDGFDRANNTLHTTFTIYGFFSLFFLFLLAGIIFNVQSIFNINPEKLIETRVLFGLVGLSYLIIMFTASLNSPLYAKNKLYVIHGLNIFRNLLKLVLVIFFAFTTSNVAAIGMAYFISAFFGAILAIFVFIKNTTYYSFFKGKFSFAEAKSITSLSIWTLVSQIGIVALSQGSLILVGAFLSNRDAGVLSILSQWPTLVINMAAITSVVFAPYIMIHFSKNELQELKDFVLKVVYYQSIWSGLIVGLIASFSSKLLELWVGIEFSQYSLLLIIMLLPMTFTQGFRPLYTVNTAYNRVSRFGIFYCFAGILHLFFSFCFMKYSEIGLIATIISIAFFTFIMDGLVLPLYVAKYTKIQMIQFLKTMLISFATCLISFSIATVSQSALSVNSWWELALTVFISLLISIPFVFTLIKEDEKRRLADYCSCWINK